MKRNKPFSKIFYVLCLLLLVSFDMSSQEENMPNGFDYIKVKIPTVVFDIRYYGTHNFIGKPIDGYNKATAILSVEALEKLADVQDELKAAGLGVKIFDAYRPQQAVDHFVRWAKDEKDTLTKAEFYPDVAKKDLFKLDYIASKSGHTRGSTVDVTIVDLKTGKEIDMGSPYDFFGKISWPNDKSISEEQHANRMLLRKVMLSNGFKPYHCEWWHFTLENEPYPNTYFNFPVE